VAGQAERLLLVAADTTWVILTRRHRVLAQKVVRVDLARPNVAGVTADAEALLMAIRATPAVVAGHELVTSHKVRIVAGVVQPGRRQQFAAGKAGRHQAVRLRQVAGRTSSG